MKRFENFKRTRDFFIGIDSDGCAFDTMELKHKECFIPNTIKFWNLQPVSRYARESAEFVNLYSKWRGINRFPAIILTLELLEKRYEVKRRNVKIPDINSLREWVREETKLGNITLKQKVEKIGDPILKTALEWSTTINAAVADMVKGVAPFPFVRESLDRAVPYADMMVVSATPFSALNMEWEEHDIAKYVQAIAGQEMGSKTEHLSRAASQKYAPGKMLMIGDAPGDLKAARKNNALFFPVLPGEEEKSWEIFYREALDKFLKGEYAGGYEKKLIEEFEKHLPEIPPWE
ncbi:MAG: HAD family hydrolase [Candidatus Eremiobacteraeota bacterium]|nr:HAD family hydrolase [Candidatus Eremiobacteraeota bacterium]